MTKLSPLTLIPVKATLLETGGSVKESIIRIVDVPVLDVRCFVNPAKWVCFRDRTNCLICEKLFGPFRRRHNCRMCGDIVCGKCSIHKRVNLPIGGENKARICQKCSLQERRISDILPTTEPCFPVQFLARSCSLETPSPSSTVVEAQHIFGSEDCDGVSAAIAAAVAATETARREEEACMAAIASKEAAARHAMQLEKEVKKSKARVRELELFIEKIRNEEKKIALSAEQQQELEEARSMIKKLQAKLLQKEEERRRTTLIAKDELISSCDSSAALKKKLHKMERQLKNAGINIAEDIPYEEAKQKIAEISKRMQEISSEEMGNNSKEEQAKRRKEYFILEQQMEKYNTALLMADEYILEQKLLEEEWINANEHANEEALKKLRSCIPIEIAHLSEAALTQMVTPNGSKLSRQLAQKIKRTNILELVRIHPDNISKMHPSVIEGYRLTGLSILERRGIYAVLKRPMEEWKKQSKEELAMRKFCWANKLVTTLKGTITGYEKHLQQHGLPGSHRCDLIGKQCPLKGESEMDKLYLQDLGFPQGSEYHIREIIKSDPEGAGEKALAEAKAHAKAMVTDQRLKELKKHYGLQVREIALAAGTLDEIDNVMERMDLIENEWAMSYVNRKPSSCLPFEGETSSYAALLGEIKSFISILAKRSGMNLSGKRDPLKDEKDTRSFIEISLSENLLEWIVLLLQDMGNRVDNFSEKRAYRGLVNSISLTTQNIKEIQHRGKVSLSMLNSEDLCFVNDRERPSWSQRIKNAQDNFSAEGTEKEVSAEKAMSSVTVMKPKDKPLLNAIKSNREFDDDNENSNVKAPVALLAAIKKKKAKTNVQTENTSPNIPIGVPVNSLLMSIRMRGQQPEAIQESSVISCA